MARTRSSARTARTARTAPEEPVAQRTRRVESIVGAPPTRRRARASQAPAPERDEPAATAAARSGSSRRSAHPPDPAAAQPQPDAPPSAGHVTSGDDTAELEAEIARRLSEVRMEQARGRSALDETTPISDWVRSSGWTPIEFLVECYRNPFLKVPERIAAAKAVLEYAHRKNPARLELTDPDGKPLSIGMSSLLDPTRLAALTDEELHVFTSLVNKIMTGAGSDDARLPN